jgi:hypothetical protein
MTSVQQEEDFKMIVQDSVMTSIADLLSADAMQALVSYVPPELLVTSPEEFHSRLSTILHDGAEILEYLILKDLAGRLGIRPPDEDGVNIIEFMEKGRAAALGEKMESPKGDLS